MTDQVRSRANASSTSLLAIVTAAFAIGIFIADTTTKLEIAVAVLYVAVVLMAARFCRARGVVLVAAGCVGLTVLSYFLTPHGPIPAAVTNTLISISTIGLTTFLVLQSQSAEVTLREQANLLNLTHDTIFVRDMSDVITYWNRGAQELCGWTAEEAIGKRTHDLLKTVFPVPLEQIEAEVMRAGHWEGELVHTKKDGTQLTVSSRWSLQRDERGAPVEVLETNNDITDRKRADEALRRQANLLEQTHDAILVWEFSGTILYWNHGAEQLYGFSKQEAIGRLSHDLLRTEHPMPAESFEAMIERHGTWTGELTHTTRDGRRIIVESRHLLMREPDGRRLVLETNRDITERKRAEEEVRKLNQELEQRVIDRTLELEAVNKELEAFAYSVSHDLRAPLRHMAGYAELLQKNASSILDEKSRRYMMMILESAKRMGTLIDDLLAFSRIGRAETQKTEVSLEQLVKEALSEVRQETDGRNMSWKIGALPNVYGDRSMLRLTLVNLISNAVKFTRTRPQPEIEIGCVDGKEDEIVVFIKDNGVGFEMKYVKKLFGVFQRLHRAEEFEGTGIGLATVQRIIHRHGGRVWAEGLVDQGATFYFSVPKS
jgi:PAS domain S-box-containing protein